MIDSLPALFANFEFLRPGWLLALLLLPLLLLLERRRRRNRDGWQRAVDPHLLPHLLQQSGSRESLAPTGLLSIGSLLAILALAGPSWRMQPAPLWQVAAPLLIALDLSSAMTATDLPPSRLVQARAKIRKLLDERRGGQVGLLVFAGAAFTVAPITRDAKTVTALLDSLSTDLMPVDGQRADSAIAHAVEMLANAAFKRGDILIVSDHADERALRAAMRAREAGFRVSALGIGTEGGAPIANKNGFVQGADGRVQLARLDPASLVALSAEGGGSYASLSIDEADLRALGVLDAKGRSDPAAQGDSAVDASGAPREGGVQRVDDGYWLLLGLLPLALFGFRRGWLALFMVVGLGSGLMPGLNPSVTQAYAAAVETPVPGGNAEPAAQTAPSAASELWSRLWQRDDQRARKALDGGNLDQARALAPDPALRASAAYRGEDFAAAAEDWSRQDQPDAHYNRGNALAKAGKLKEAIEAYDQALARAPTMEDAIANRKAVEDLLKQQQKQQSKDDQSGDDKKDDKKSGQDQKQDKKSGKDQDPDEKSGEDQKQEGEPGEGQNQDGKPEEGEQQSEAEKPGDGEQPKNESSDQAKPDEQAESGSKKSPDQGRNDDDRSEPPTDAQSQAVDAAAQKAAEEAAKRQMQAALERAAEQQPAEPGKDVQARVETPEERMQSERKQAIEQWLRRVPDDPGGLLRQKFAREYQRRRAQGEE